MAAAPQKPGGTQPTGNPAPNQPAQAQRSPEALAAAAANAARELAEQGVPAAAGENDEQLAQAWGFTEKRRRMSREATIGMLAVLSLVGLFGYLAWKKWKGRAPVVVAKQDDEVKNPDPFDDSKGLEKTKFDEEKPTNDVTLEFPEDPEVSKKKPKGKEIVDDMLDLGGEQTEPPPKKFAQEEESLEEPPTRTTRREPTFDLDDADDTLTKPKEPVRLRQPETSEEDFAEPVRVPVTPQKPRKPPVRLPDVDQFAQNTQSELSQPPSTTDLPPSKRSSRHPLLRENEYLVEPGDNFCIISKKLYGTGRYFSALAEANRNRVADPCRMRPGLIISVPPREELEKRFSELIPETRQADGARDKEKADGSPGNKRPSATAQAGLFKDDDGQIYYRVGEGDTLSEIAENHLGRMSRAEQIVNMNRLTDPHNLKIGQILKMPSDATPVRLVETDKEIR